MLKLLAAGCALFVGVVVVVVAGVVWPGVVEGFIENISLKGARC